MVIEVMLGGPAHLYSGTAPAGAVAVGTIRHHDGREGALLRFKTGAYAQMTGDAIRALDRREVLLAMSAALAR